MFNLGWSKSITTGVTVQVVKVKRFLTRKIKTSEYCPLLHPTSVLYFLPLLSTHTYLSFFPSHLISMFTRWRDFSLHLGRLAVQGCPFCIQDIRMKWELDRHTSPPPHCPSFLSRAKKETWLRDVLWWLLLRFGTSLSWVLRLKRWWMGFQLNVPDRQMKPFSFTFCVSSTDDSVPSSDSLSDSSPPAPGVPTQVVQSVQTTPQVKMHTYIHYDGNSPVCWRQCGHQRAHHTYCGTALWSGLTGMTFTKHYKKFSTFNLTLWLYTSTEVSVASRVSGSQEESDRPRQQSTVCAYNPRGKEDNSSHHFISMSVMPHHVHWSATAHRCQFCFISCNP